MQLLGRIPPGNPKKKPLSSPKTSLNLALSSTLGRGGEGGCPPPKKFPPRPPKWDFLLISPPPPPAGAGAPVAAAVRSHFDDCPDSHSQFCFHGTCRFLVQEDKPACV